MFIFHNWHLFVASSSISPVYMVCLQNNHYDKANLSSPYSACLYFRVFSSVAVHSTRRATILNCVSNKIPVNLCRLQHYARRWRHTHMSLMLSILAWIFSTKLSTSSCEMTGIQEELQDKWKCWRQWQYKEHIWRLTWRRWYKRGREKTAITPGGERNKGRQLTWQPYSILIDFQQETGNVCFLLMMSRVRPLHSCPRYVTRYIRTRS